MIRDLARDASAYSLLGGWFRNLGFWVVATYRLGARARTLPLPLRIPLRAVYWMVRQPWRLILHAEIPAAARIGAGFCLVHPYNVLIGPGVVIGEDCAVYHEVTVGAGPRPGMPRIGSRVALFVGARVLGGVDVGDSAEIGANCVVITDVPAGSVVAPTPARAIPKSLVRRRDDAATAAQP